MRENDKGGRERGAERERERERENKARTRERESERERASQRKRESGSERERARESERGRKIPVAGNEAGEAFADPVHVPACGCRLQIFEFWLQASGFDI